MHQLEEEKKICTSSIFFIWANKFFLPLNVVIYLGTVWDGLLVKKNEVSFYLKEMEVKKRLMKHVIDTLFFEVSSRYNLTSYLVQL